MQARLVFVSYRRDGGGDAARVVRDALVQRRFRVFMDVQDLGSGHFKEAILEQIKQCSDFVTVLTPGALDRCNEENDWLRWEIAQAIALGKNIVPVLTEGFVAWPALPPEIAMLPSFQALGYARHLHDASMDKLASWLRQPLRRRVPRSFWAPAVALLALGLVATAWEYLSPPGPVVRLVKGLIEPPSPAKRAQFSQSFMVHGPSGASDLPASGELAIVIQCRDAVSNAPVGLDGQAVLRDLPFTWKDQEAKISISGRDWRLAEATNTFRLSGEKIVLALERQDIVIRGRVGEAGSNAPLADVAVSVASLTNTTDRQGQFNLAIPGRLVRMPLTLSARRTGYQPVSMLLTNLAEPLTVSLAKLPPPVPVPFTQTFVLRGPGGTNDLLTDSDAVVILRLGARSYREAVTEQGEAVFENLPAASRNQQAEVTLDSRHWQLAGGTNLVRLSGNQIMVALERSAIVIRGLVLATNSETTLPKAQVSIGGVTNMTDRRGRFGVSVPGRLVGSPLTLAVTLPDYQPFSRKISDPGQEQEILLSPVPPAPKPPPLPPTNQIVQVRAPGGGTDAIVSAGSFSTASGAQAVAASNSKSWYSTRVDVEKLLDRAREERQKATPKGMKNAEELSKLAVSYYRALADEDFKEYGPALAIALLRRAELLASNPTNQAAGDCYLEAKEICRRLDPHDSSVVAVAPVFNNYAVFLSSPKDSRQNPQIVDAYQQAITVYSNAASSVPDEARLGLANTYRNLGAHHKTTKDFTSAVASYQESVRIYQALPLSQDPEIIIRRLQALTEFASTLDKVGRREQARSNYLAAITACEALGEKNRLLYREELARVQSEYGGFLDQPSDPTPALPAYEQAIGLYRELATNQNWTNRTDYASTLNSYAVLLDKINGSSRAAEVDRAYKEALSLSRAARDRRLELRILSNQGVALENQDRLPEARDKYLEALKFGAKYLDQEPVEIGARLADVHLKLAELEYSQRFSPDRAERTTHLKAAAKELNEARKLVSKLPPSPDKTDLENHVQRLGIGIDAAMPK